MDIIKLPIEYEKDTVDSRFRLVLIAAQRARQLSEGSNVLVVRAAAPQPLLEILP